ncbi:hypothetical protein BD769DRAFT_1667470 [Suillus cothurnatus]|nr:hypothetical protein BD769DRAFT_1667470 [Suillus cothurnatus]
MCCWRQVRNVYLRCGHAITLPDELFQVQIQPQPPGHLPSALMQADLLPVVRTHDSFAIAMTDWHDDETFLLPLHSHFGHRRYSNDSSDHQSPVSSAILAQHQ